ncbi:MAG: PrsW family intramembrane metalloprotease [Firmicutes bacterium]|nr:PrsW family intramembrane metalloprotease [Bacillota bacterium]
MSVLVLLLSFIPAILMFFFLRKNREDPDYRKACGKLLWKGVLSAALVTLADLIVVLLWGLTGLGDIHWLVNALFKTFVIFATVEEAVKFRTAKKALNEQRAVSRLDVISFMAISAMGFGMIEDVVYMLETNIGQIIVRGVMMGHVGYGLIMGLIYSKGMKNGSKFAKFLGLLIPILIHGLYDFSLTENLPEVFDFLAVLNAFGVTVFIIVMIFIIRKKRKDPEFTVPFITKDEETAVPEAN